MIKSIVYDGQAEWVQFVHGFNLGIYHTNGILWFVYSCLENSTSCMHGFMPCNYSPETSSYGRRERVSFADTSFDLHI